MRRDKNRIILTVDKSVSMEVMDRDDYNNKAEELLTPTSLQAHALVTPPIGLKPGLFLC